MLAACVARAQQQGGCTFTDESGKTVFWPNCEDPAEKKSPDGTTPPGKGQAPAAGQTTSGTTPGSAAPAQSFPFPGEGTTPAAPNTPGQAGQAGQQGKPGTGSPTAGQFPFPEQDSGGGGPLKDAGSSGNTPNPGSSSSSSSSSGPPDRDPAAGPLGDGDDDPAAKAAEARRAARPKKGIVFHQTADERETEDLKIAAFYQDDGNFRGAYERATDAVSLAADDADAHFALAEAARRLGKLDEALAHYKKCLTLDPMEKTKKAAEKALKQMTAGG